MRFAHAVPVLALLAGCGDPLFFAEVQAKKVCVTLPNQSVTGVPAGLTQDHVMWEGDYSLGDAVNDLESKGASVNLEVLDFKITDTTGTADLRGITQVTVALSANGMPTTNLLDYAQPTSPPAHEIDMSGQSVDVGTYLESGKLHYRVSATGALPSATWTAEMQSCMWVRAKVDALKAMQGN